MPTPGEAIKGPEILNQPGAEWIEMNVAGQLKKIGFFLNHN
jgi:hypothetical protein